MKLRLQADNDLDHRIVAATRRREPSIDFQTVPALGLQGRVPDARVLTLTADEGSSRDTCNIGHGSTDRKL